MVLDIIYGNISRVVNGIVLIMNFIVRILIKF